MHGNICMQDGYTPILAALSAISVTFDLKESDSRSEKIIEMLINNDGDVEETTSVSHATRTLNRSKTHHVLSSVAVS